MEALNVTFYYTEHKNNKSWSIKTHRHEPCSFGYKVVCREDDNYSKPYKSYRGGNAIYKFFESLFEEEKNISEILDKFKYSKPELSVEEANDYKNSKNCYICDNIFTETNRKVRDHNHITGKYRGAACDNCNKHLRLSNTIQYQLYFII